MLHIYLGAHVGENLKKGGNNQRPFVCTWETQCTTFGVYMRLKLKKITSVSVKNSSFISEVFQTEDSVALK